MPYTAKQIVAAHEVVSGKSTILAKPFARQIIREAHTMKTRPPVKPSGKTKAYKW